MCIIKNVFLIVTFASATKAISESVSICEPQLKSSWTYNYETNISDYSEINTNLETISLNFDFGFLKLSAQADGKYSLEDNPLVSAPHTAAVATADEWGHAYSRSEAIYPSEFTKDNKYWPPVGRLDNVFGDRNLVCSCPSIKDYE